jgi:hypothetical protein
MSRAADRNPWACAAIDENGKAIMSQQVSDIPREKLKALFDRNGESLLQDADRCEGLLKDHCSSYRREISALVGALEERVPLELKSSWQTAMTPEAMRARLVQRLEENRGLAPDVANWAVDAWSYALGVGLGRQSDRVVVPSADSPADFNPAGPRADGSGFANSAATTWGPSTPAMSVADRVASDRVSGAPGVAPIPAGPEITATGRPLGKKAGIGAIALLAIGAAAWGVMHRSEPGPAPAPPPVPAPAPPKGGGSGQVRPQPMPRPAPQPLPEVRKVDDRPKNPPPQSNPSPAVAAPEMRRAQDRMIDLEARADAAVSGVESIRRQQQAQGYDMRGDVLAAMNRMRSYLAAANRALAQRNTEMAASAMDKAEVDLSTLEKFLGR